MLFGNTPDEIQKSLNILDEYCNRWRLTVNISKTKILVFRKEGRVPDSLLFIYLSIYLYILSQPHKEDIRRSERKHN